MVNQPAVQDTLEAYSMIAQGSDFGWNVTRIKNCEQGIKE
jgi:hypothetical protein